MYAKQIHDTPLHRAAAAGRDRVARCLRSAGANIGAVNKVRLPVWMSYGVTIDRVLVVIEPTHSG